MSYVSKVVRLRQEAVSEISRELPTPQYGDPDLVDYISEFFSELHYIGRVASSLPQEICLHNYKV